ncbi:N-acetyltransferase [Streptomyces litmocidini]|uniref:N-acetyltransferase n=1 Tax=Streptomyces litmocidini TaxID=67318 RepID=UPI0033CB174F
MPCPDARDDGLACLLLVHVRKVVGRVTYRTCEPCAEGVITEVVLDELFFGSGLGTRALAHLRSRHPDVRWRTTLDDRLTRDLLRRMRVRPVRDTGLCPHALPAASAATGG